MELGILLAACTVSVSRDHQAHAFPASLIGRAAAPAAREGRMVLNEADRGCDCPVVCALDGITHGLVRSSPHHGDRFRCTERQVPARAMVVTRALNLTER